MNKTNPIRAVNEGPDSEVAQHRGDVYAKCIDKYNEAISNHFFIEAVAIVESLIADRLESRKAVFLGNEDNNRFDTIGRLVGCLKKNETDKGLKTLYTDALDWAQRRNDAIHQIAKIEKDKMDNWELKYDQIKDIASDGFELFRSLSKLILPLNKAFRASNLGPGEK